MYLLNFVGIHSIKVFQMFHSGPKVFRLEKTLQPTSYKKLLLTNTGFIVMTLWLTLEYSGDFLQSTII